MRVFRGLLAVALLALLSQAARPDCPVPGPPSNLSFLTILKDANGQALYEDLQFDNVMDPGLVVRIQQTSIYVYVESRDVTGGADPAFAAYSTEPFVANYSTLVMPIHGSGAVAARPDVALGHTYEFRVYNQYTFLQGCPQYDGGVAHLTTPSNVLRVTIGEAGPSVDPPQHVVAVADPKKPRVTVTWDKPTGGDKGGTYSVQRRVVTPAPTKDASAFAEVASLDADKLTALRFLDKNVLPDTEYEYVVAIAVDQATAAQSGPDRAFTSGKCPASDFRIWDGQWRDPDALAFSFGFETTTSLFCYECSDGAVTCSQDVAAAQLTAPARFASAPKITLFDVAAGGAHKAAATFTVDHADPFSPDAWRSATATIKLKTSTAYPLLRDDIALPTTTVCGTVGSGAAALKGGVAHPGDPVAFAFDAVALGPAPLYAGSLFVTATIDGGTIAAVDGLAFSRLSGDPTGAHQALVEIGALGPKAAGRSEVAAFTVIASASSAPEDGQLRCTFAFLPVQGGPETVNTPIVARYLEVRVVPPAK